MHCLVRSCRGVHHAQNSVVAVLVWWRRQLPGTLYIRIAHWVSPGPWLGVWKQLRVGSRVYLRQPRMLNCSNCKVLLTACAKMKNASTSVYVKEKPVENPTQVYIYMKNKVNNIKSCMWRKWILQRLLTLSSGNPCPQESTSSVSSCVSVSFTRPAIFPARTVPPVSVRYRYQRQQQYNALTSRLLSSQERCSIWGL